RVKQNVAIGPRHLKREHDPSDLQGHAEFLCQRLGKLKLKAGPVSALAREWQRVRVGANYKPAALLDRIERASAGWRCRGESERQHSHDVGDWIASELADRQGSVSGLEAADIDKQRIHVGLGQPCAEGRHLSRRAGRDAAEDEVVVMLRAHQLRTTSRLAPAVLMAPAAAIADEEGPATRDLRR